jgi:hypothetical protein
MKELSKPHGEFITRWGRIDNGVYFVDTTDGPMIAVHADIAGQKLSGEARSVGTPRNRYLYYGYPAQAIPLYELSQGSRAVSEFADQARMLATLRKFYPDYLPDQNIEDELEKVNAEILEKAYTDWRQGNLYKYKGDFYDIETGEYVCPDDPSIKENENGQNNTAPTAPVGRLAFYGANGMIGESLLYTDADEYLKKIKKELPYRATSGFRFETLTDDPRVRKAVDALVYNEYGEGEASLSDEDVDFTVLHHEQEDDEDEWEP